MTEQLLDVRGVVEWSGLSKDSLYRLMARERFPRPVRIGLRAVRWRESDLQAWLDSRPRCGAAAGTQRT